MGQDLNDMVNESSAAEAGNVMRAAVNGAKNRTPKKETTTARSETRPVIQEPTETQTAAEIEKAGRRKKLLSLCSTIDKKRELPSLEMIGGLFPRGGVSFIFAKAGSKKTWLVQRLASDLSVGGSILDGYVESQPKKVLLFAGESGADIMDRRAKLTDWPVDETNLIVVDALKYDKAGEPLLLDDETGQRRIECLIEEHKPNVVFFDSLLAFHNSNENDGKEMSPIFRYVNALADESNVACVISHHPTKTKRNERKIPLDMDDMIGSSLLNRYAALVVGLEETDIDGGEKMILVSAKKSRHRRPKPFAFALIGMDDGGVRMKINLEPVVGNGAGDKALKFIKENYEPGEDFSNADIRKGGVPISHSYLSECLSKWTEKGILTRSEKTKNARYCLPAEESS